MIVSYVRRSHVARFAKIAAAIILWATAFPLSGVAHAQSADYPTGPITLVVPYNAGGGNDDLARIVANKIGEIYGHTIVVVNRPGAAGMVGGRFVSSADPDGYTIMIDGTTQVMNSILQEDFPSEILDLQPITLAVRLSNFLMVHPSVPAETAEEFIALARENPGELTYGSTGTGTFIDMAVFAEMAGIELLHVPYTGGGPAMVALLSNEVDALFAGTTGIPHIESGAVRALANTGETRAELLPDVPTITESALPGFTSGIWLGFFAPPNTPDEIIDQLNEMIVTALDDPDLRADLVRRNMAIVASTPQEFRDAIDQDRQEKQRVVDELGIEME